MLNVIKLVYIPLEQHMMKCHGYISLYNVGFAVRNAPFGQGTDPVLLYNVGCTGTESSLLNCSLDGTYLHYCLHSNDAGVVCPPCK